MQILSFLVGYRTYLAQGAQALIAIGAVLTVLATSVGTIGIESGVIWAAVLVACAQFANGLGGIFQRLATKNLKDNLAALPEDVETLRKLAEEIKRAANTKPTLPNVPPRNVTHLAVFLLLSAAGVASAAPPVAIISGPKSATPGEEIILDLTQSEGEPTVYAWRVYPQVQGYKQLTVLDDGRKCKLASFPGVYVVRGMVANDDGIDLLEWTITIPGNPPCPPAPAPSPITPHIPPGPTPTPTPVPNPQPIPKPDTLPAGEFDGLPAAVFALVGEVVSTNRAAEAAKLANAFETVAAQLAAGTLKEPKEITAAIGAAFNGAVPVAWDAVFRARAIARMRLLFETGKLATPDRWAAMLREVVAGLRAVK